MKKTRPKKIAVVLGTRPNFTKAAPFFIEAKNHPEFEFVIIHTGQHFDTNMSQVFFDQMKIPVPDVNLNISSENYSERLGKTIKGIQNVIKTKRVVGVIVIGDVDSTLAGALAAAKTGVSLFHIEAGMRSYDRRMPEEFNRVLVDHLSEILFTVEETATGNLIREGVPASKIKLVGNIATESIEIFRKEIAQSDVLKKLKLNPKLYVVATIHRAENTDSRKNLGTILEVLRLLSKTFKIVIPLHPGTRNKISRCGLSEKLSNLEVIEPLGYFDFMKLITCSSGVITDSGGIQAETTHLGIPCATLRENTEFALSLKIGSNKLFPLSSKSVTEIKKHLRKRNFRSGHIPLWDGKVSRRIFSLLKKI